jgi:DHA1 family multidrug resistance protein-like MFS transporter
MAFAQLVAIAGFTVVMPILPLYVRHLGVQGERETSLWAGIVFSSQAVTMAVFGPIWGVISDRHGRKVMVERAMFGGAVLLTLMGMAQNVQQLALLRLVQGAVTGVITASNALVATTAPRERAGYALGLLQMAQYVGASLGPLLGGLISDQWGFRAAFGVTGALLFLAGLGVLLMVHERFVPAASSPDDPPVAGRRLGSRLRSYMAPVLGSTPLLIVLGMRILTRLGARLTGPVLPLFVESIAPPTTAVASLTGLISGANAAAGAVGALWLGPLGDRVGSRKILMLCTAGAALCYVPHFFVTNPSWLIPLQAIAGLTMGGVLASLSAELARLSQEGQEGIVYGLAGSAMAIANAIGPMLGSVTAAYLGLATPFLVAAALFALTSAAAARLLPETRT